MKFPGQTGCGAGTGWAVPCITVGLTCQARADAPAVHRAVARTGLVHDFVEGQVLAVV